MSPDLANMARGVATEAAFRRVAKMVEDREPEYLRNFWRAMNEGGGFAAIRRESAKAAGPAYRPEPLDKLWGWLWEGDPPYEP